MAYVIIYDEYKLFGTHWRALYLNGDILTYFYTFRVEYIPPPQKKNWKIHRKQIYHDKYYIVLAHDSVMRGYCYIDLYRFISFMLRNNSLAGFTNLFYPGNLKKDEKIIK